MKAVTWQDVRDVRLDDVPEPELESPGDVIIRVTCAAICGSDLHVFHGEVPGMLPGTICGHEFTGVIESAGDQVYGFSKGDRVVGPFTISCGLCPPCRRGEYHLCRENIVLGWGMVFGGVAGTQAQYARIPHADINLRRIPDGMDDEKAIFCGDVLTTAYGAVRNADLRPGDTVAVVGCGPVGIMAVQSALAMGASRVWAIDLVEERAALAASAGAEPIVSSRTNPVSRINEATDGEGVDVVIEAVGGTKTLELAFDLVRPGGRIAAVGISAAESFQYPLMSALAKDVSFRIGVANVLRDIDATLKLVETGRIDPLLVVSHRIPLTDAVEGYRLFDEKKANKILIHP
ncbi:MAG: alcohol dehydrogenase family protein [Thermoanaerobaculia bacterium]